MQALSSPVHAQTRAEALWSWLSDAAASARVEALLVADASGLLVESSLPGPAAVGLAAMAPRAAAGAVAPMTTLAFTCQGAPLLLAAVGAPDRCRAALDAALPGVRSILEG